MGKFVKAQAVHESRDGIESPAFAPVGYLAYPGEDQRVTSEVIAASMSELGFAPNQLLTLDQISRVGKEVQRLVSRAADWGGHNIYTGQPCDESQWCPPDF